MSESQRNMDTVVSTSDIKPLVGRVLASRTRLEWVLIVVGVILGIVLIVFIAAYSHCMGMYKDLKHANDDAQAKPQLEEKHCSHLGGAWYNTLGSEMILNTTHGQRGFLFGEYRTAVERKAGAAGGEHSIIVGAHPSRDPGAVFAFSVMWRDGMSMTTWTGQCMSCDGEEKLITSWLLRSKQSDCIDAWKSTMIHEDVFTRDPLAGGPKRNMSQYEPSKELLEIMKWKPSADLETKVLEQKGGDHLCSLDGPWLSDTNDELALTHEHGTIIEGRYRSEIEHNLDFDLTIQHSLVYGMANSEVANSTAALFVGYDGGKTVTGWTAQCHICKGHSGGQEEVLVTTWLHRSQVVTCKDNWKSTLFGQTNYRRPANGTRETVPTLDQYIKDGADFGSIY